MLFSAVKISTSMDMARDSSSRDRDRGPLPFEVGALGDIVSNRNVCYHPTKDVLFVKDVILVRLRSTQSGRIAGRLQLFDGGDQYFAEGLSFVQRRKLTGSSVAPRLGNNRGQGCRKQRR